MSKKAELIVEDRKIQVSNLDKVLYPKVGFTKGQVIDYYIRIAPMLLPHLKDRPLTMKRYPDGVEGEFFYEKNCPVHRPKWVKTARVWSESNNRMMNYCLAQDLPTLVWAANLADLELHTSLARKNNIKRPTMMVFDLDPGAPADIVQCCQVGIWLSDLLLKMKLKSFAKTSGSKGLQVYVPLNSSSHSTKQKIYRARSLSISKQIMTILLLRTCRRQSAKRRYLSIGARTTNTKLPSASIHSAQKKSRPLQPPLPGMKFRTV